MKEEEIFKLENIDPEDISDVLVKVEKSFNIKFGDTELKDVQTFGELCDIIVSKIELQDSNDCTTQQAFYKLRNAILKATSIDKTDITSNTQLGILFPPKNRRKKIKMVEKELGFTINVLKPKDVFLNLFLILFIFSFLSLFASWNFGFIGLLISIVGAIVANKFGKELALNTVGELVEKISRENYMSSRRNIETINRAEIVQKIEQLFSNDLGLELHLLTREATFN